MSHPHSVSASQSKAPARNSPNSFDRSQRYETDDDGDNLRRVGKQTYSGRSVLDNNGFACAGGSYTRFGSSTSTLPRRAGLESGRGCCYEGSTRSEILWSFPSWAFDGHAELSGRVEVPAVGHRRPFRRRRGQAYNDRERRVTPMCGSAATADTPLYLIKTLVVHLVDMVDVETAMLLKCR